MVFARGVTLVGYVDIYQRVFPCGWCAWLQFQENEFPTLSGARIVRIATHPDATRMGYGSAALERLRQYFEVYVCVYHGCSMPHAPCSILRHGVRAVSVSLALPLGGAGVPVRRSGGGR